MPPPPPQSVRSEPQASPSTAPQRARHCGAASASSPEAGDSFPGHLVAHLEVESKSRADSGAGITLPGKWAVLDASMGAQK